MISPLNFWEKKHRKYSSEAWIHDPNYFAEKVAGLVKPGDQLLDLGCGQGQDSLYFARLGAEVTATDFSPFALAQFEVEARAAGILQLEIDLSDAPYGFADGSFDIVYSHLSLHYLSEGLTQAAFAEVARVLRVGGHFLATFNSVDDEEFGTGHQLESHYFELDPGDRKRFFDKDQLLRFTAGLFQVDEIAFVQGTRKKDEDRYVELLATRTEGER